MRFVVQVIPILYWLMFLQDTDSYYIPNLIVCVLGCISCYENVKGNWVFKKDRESFIIVISSVIFSSMTISANFYYLRVMIQDNYSNMPLIGKVMPLLIFWGGFFAFGNILAFLAHSTKLFYWKRAELKWLPEKIFSISFFLIFVINSFILIAAYYPGIVSSDSLNSILQMQSGYYSNHHPFYYTMLVKVFMTLGLKWFNNINIAVLLYSIFQIIFMAACFSYVIVTLYQMGISLKIIIGCWIWYVMMPYHIMYSFTMWKDVPFGGFVVVFIVSAFRIFRDIGRNSRRNKILLVTGSVGICLFRSNGWFAFLATFFCFLFLFGKDSKNRKLGYIFLEVLLVTFILKNPVLQYLNVTQPDMVEYLSIPIQQIARTIKYCDNVDEEHKKLLDKIVDVERIPKTYDIFISDPMKNLIREAGNQEYLKEHKGEYFSLYIKMGLSHPDKYFEAWVDQTKGYWNGGYSYWIWIEGIEKNDLGIQQTVYSESVRNVIKNYIGSYFSSSVSKVFLCIGFHVWLVLGIAIICVIQRNKEALFLTIPIISIVISLLLTTPVYSEFRYIYSLFCSIPFLIIAPFYKGNSNIN